MAHRDPQETKDHRESVEILVLPETLDTRE